MNSYKRWATIYKNKEVEETVSQMIEASFRELGSVIYKVVRYWNGILSRQRYLEGYEYMAARNRTGFEKVKSLESITEKKKQKTM